MYRARRDAKNTSGGRKNIFSRIRRFENPSRTFTVVETYKNIVVVFSVFSTPPLPSPHHFFFSTVSSDTRFCRPTTFYFSTTRVRLIAEITLLWYKPNTTRPLLLDFVSGLERTSTVRINIIIAESLFRFYRPDSIFWYN